MFLLLLKQQKAGLDLYHKLPELNAAAVGDVVVAVLVAAAVGGRWMIRLCEPGPDSLPTIESPADANAEINCCCRR